MFGAGQPTHGDGVAGVQVGPVAGDVESAGFGGDQVVFVGLSSGQGAGLIQLHQIIFEHTFNIRPRDDSLTAIRRHVANGQHHVDPDNTCQPTGG